MAFYEIRQYEIRPGKMTEWLKLFQEEILPFQISKGMVVAGAFEGETDESVFFWVRRFENEAHRAALYEAVYESDIWKNEMAGRVGQLINRDTITVSRVKPLALSVLQ